MAPFNGLFAIGHFYHLFFYLYPHSKGLLPHSRIFCIPLPSFKGIIASFKGLFAIGSFAYLYPHSKGLLPHLRVFLQQAILNLFFYLYPHSKRLLPHLMVFFYLYPQSKGYCPIQGSFAISHPQPFFLPLPSFEWIIAPFKSL